MAVALDPHPRYRVFYIIIVIQLQQEQKYNKRAVRSETPSSTGLRPSLPVWDRYREYVTSGHLNLVSSN